VSVGSDLREAREARGLTLADASRSTRIRATLIGLIEDDQWESCGGDVYARGHIRALAGAAGVDPAPLVAAYDEQRGAGPVALRAALDESTGGPQIRERRGPNWLAAAVGAAAVATVLLAASTLSGLVSGGAGPARPRAAALTPGTPGTASAAPASPAASPGPSLALRPTPSALLAQRAPVVVRVKVTQAPGSWVHVEGGASVFEGVLRPGTTRDFVAQKQIAIRFGNAGAVELTVNGEVLGAPGAPGEVTKVLTFGPGAPPAPAQG